MTNYEMILAIVLFVIILCLILITNDIMGIIIILLLAFGVFWVIRIAKLASDKN